MPQHNDSCLPLADLSGLTQNVLSDMPHERMKISFFVEGKPVPKARPRVTRHGAYTPLTTRDWEQQVRLAYQLNCRGLFFEKHVALKFRAEIVCRGRGRAASIAGDWENYAKAICDALNGLAYVDDIQIVDGQTVKRRARKGEPTGVFVAIELANSG